MTDPLRASATELARRVKAREVSPLELVDAHIRALLHWNPSINALIANRFERARAEARVMGERLAAGTRDDGVLPPLFGVPFTAKESLGVVGMPHTSGSILRRHDVAKETAPAVQRVIDAGGICLGVTNVPELAFWIETNNRLFGRTANPWDLERTPGGSSGGEAAVVAAGASPFGIATDAGGSIRVPASFCGVYGHKPSGGLVPSTNHIPSPSPKQSRFVSVGPIARSAHDLATILRVIAGPDGRDPGCTPMELEDPTTVRVDRLRVRVLTSVAGFTVTPVLRAAVARAAAALQARGAKVEEAHLPELGRALEMWGDALKATAETPFEHWLGAGNPVALVRELLRLARGRSIHTLPALSFLLVERLSGVVDLVKGGFAQSQALRDRLHAELGDDGVILAPVFSVNAPRHREALLKARDFALAGIWNVLETPATAVPMGFDGHRMPVGIQVIARPGNDAATIACAMALEDDLGGWSPPPSP